MIGNTIEWKQLQQLLHSFCFLDHAAWMRSGACAVECQSMNHCDLLCFPCAVLSACTPTPVSTFSTFLGSMNERIREQAEVANPFDFEHVKSLKNMADFADVGPAVVMASPGGLQSGLSRVLFDQWCQDRK